MYSWKAFLTKHEENCQTLQAKEFRKQESNYKRQIFSDITLDVAQEVREEQQTKNKSDVEGKLILFENF